MRKLIYTDKNGVLANQNSVVEATLKKLYSVFDIDKNGKVEVTEVCAALSVLCSGSITRKIEVLFHDTIEPKRLPTGEAAVTFEAL